MQTLGLYGEAKRSDGVLKSLFWPTVENAWDVDYLERQGFWICVLIAAIKAIASFLSGNPILIIAGVFEAIIFAFAAMGIREGSLPAAATIFVIYLLDLVYATFRGIPPGFLTIILAAILLSNLRAAYLASRWTPVTDDGDKPTRFHESFRDKLVDVLPARAWPLLKWPFFAMAALLLVLSIAGMGSLRGRRSSVPSNPEITQP